MVNKPRPRRGTVWLRQPSSADLDYTNAEHLGVDEELTAPDSAGSCDVRDVLAADPNGVHRRTDITRVQLWLVPDGEVLDHGAVITSTWRAGSVSPASTTT